MQKSILIRELQLRVKHRLKKHARQKHRGETFRLNRDNHQKYQKKKKKSTEAAFSQQEARSIKVSLYYKSVSFLFRFWGRDDCWQSESVIAWWVQSQLQSIYTEKHTAQVQEVSCQESRSTAELKPWRRSKTLTASSLCENSTQRAGRDTKSLNDKLFPWRHSS